MIKIFDITSKFYLNIIYMLLVSYTDVSMWDKDLCVKILWFVFPMKFWIKLWNKLVLKIRT